MPKVCVSFELEIIGHSYLLSLEEILEDLTNGNIYEFENFKVEEIKET